MNKHQELPKFVVKIITKKGRTQKGRYFYCYTNTDVKQAVSKVRTGSVAKIWQAAWKRPKTIRPTVAVTARKAA